MTRYSFRRLKADEFESAYAILAEVTAWLLSKGVRQWLQTFPREMYAERHTRGENYGLFVHGELDEQPEQFVAADAGELAEILENLSAKEAEILGLQANGLRLSLGQLALCSRARSRLLNLLLCRRPCQLSIGKHLPARKASVSLTPQACNDLGPNTTQGRKNKGRALQTSKSRCR